MQLLKMHKQMYIVLERHKHDKYECSNFWQSPGTDQNKSTVYGWSNKRDHLYYEPQSTVYAHLNAHSPWAVSDAPSHSSNRQFN